MLNCVGVCTVCAEAAPDLDAVGRVAESPEDAGAIPFHLGDRRVEGLLLAGALRRRLRDDPHRRRGAAVLLREVLLVAEEGDVGGEVRGREAQVPPSPARVGRFLDV